MAVLSQAACTRLEEPLLVETRPSKLVLFNNTADTLQYAAFERQAALFMKWKPCYHPLICGDRGIKPGLSRDVPYLLIHNWYPGAQVTVFWWRLIPDSTVAQHYRVDGPFPVTLPTPTKPLTGS